jgi:signal transduction histidine kinase
MLTQRLPRGLLARVTTIYALGALLLSATVAFTTFMLAQSRLLSDVESQHRQQVYRNASNLQQQLLGVASSQDEDAESPAGPTGGPGEQNGSAPAITAAETTVTTAATTTTSTPVREPGGRPGEEINPTTAGTTDDSAGEDEELLDAEDVLQPDDIYSVLLRSVPVPNGSFPLMIPPDGVERSQNLKVRDIPTDLQIAVSPGLGDTRTDDPELAIAQLRYDDGEFMNYAIGVRLELVEVTYYEVLRLDELEATLNSLRVILIGVAALASIAGAGLGYYSARGALKPLAETSDAAHAIAAGDFSTKLDMAADRDLRVVTDAFNEMVDAVSDRIERERRFTSDVAHELRSPLMTLTASVEILERRQESLPAVAQQAVELLSQDLRRFQQLVEDLLEVSRMEAGAVQLQLSRFRLSEFLENVIYQSRSPHLELRYDPEDAFVSITADKRRLAQVMTNLIDNAEKYGNGADAVWFDVVGDNAQIIVADSGPGVPAHQRERIFERFGRAEGGKRGTASGFGLGLSLVAEHVRLHGGQVWVTDRIDGEAGARFVVQLPVGEHVDVLEEMAQ